MYLDLTQSQAKANFLEMKTKFVVAVAASVDVVLRGSPYNLLKILGQERQEVTGNETEVNLQK